MDIPQERKLVTEIPGPNSREWFARRAKRRRRRRRRDPPDRHRARARRHRRGRRRQPADRLRDRDRRAQRGPHARPRWWPPSSGRPSSTPTRASTSRANEPYIELAERLNALTPGDARKKTMFVNSGAEAVENAVKIARKATGRQAIVTFDHAFHGRTLMAMTLTAKVMPYKQGMGPFAPEIYRLPFAYPYRCPCGRRTRGCGAACLAYALDEMHKHIGEENIAAVIMEPIQGEGGFVVPAPGFVAGHRRLLRGQRHRVHRRRDPDRAWAGPVAGSPIEDEGVVPDLVTTAKSLGGGLPIGAVTGRAELMDAVHAGRAGRHLRRQPGGGGRGARGAGQDRARGPARRAPGSIGETIMTRLRGVARRATRSSATCAGAARCARSSWSSDRATKEPLDAARMNAIAARLPRARRHRADGRHLRERRAAAAADQHRRARCSTTASTSSTRRSPQRLLADRSRRRPGPRPRLLASRPWTDPGPRSSSLVRRIALDIEPLRVSRDFRLIWGGLFDLRARLPVHAGGDLRPGLRHHRLGRPPWGSTGLFSFAGPAARRRGHRAP